VSDIVMRILEVLRRQDVFLAALATVDADGRPCVRYVRARIADDLTIRCPTFAGTSKVRHIGRDPRVALTCGDTDSSRPGSYFEVRGEARISTDDADRRAAWNPNLEKWFSGLDDPNYAVVVIRPTRIEALPIGGGPEAQVWEDKL
jgi:general stress protein 26